MFKDNVDQVYTLLMTALLFVCRHADGLVEDFGHGGTAGADEDAPQQGHQRESAAQTAPKVHRAHLTDLQQEQRG